jgi:hypothetical protein
MIFPKFHITLKIQNHYKVIFSVFHDIFRKQPQTTASSLVVILRYEAASLHVWFPAFREKVRISERSAAPLGIAAEHCLADNVGKT